MTEDNNTGMVEVRFYVPRKFEELVRQVSESDGITKSELYRHALFHGLSIYAERSNKIRINSRLHNNDSN